MTAITTGASSSGLTGKMTDADNLKAAITGFEKSWERDAGRGLLTPKPHYFVRENSAETAAMAATALIMSVFSVLLGLIVTVGVIAVFEKLLAPDYLNVLASVVMAAFPIVTFIRCYQEDYSEVLEKWEAQHRGLHNSYINRPHAKAHFQPHDEYMAVVNGLGYEIIKIGKNGYSISLGVAVPSDSENVVEVAEMGTSVAEEVARLENQARLSYFAAKAMAEEALREKAEDERTHSITKVGTEQVMKTALGYK